MEPLQNYWWGVALELRLRQSSGDAFQDFFSILMGKLHGDDFVRVRAYGKLGDKGCDGYLKSSGQVFACYGAVNGEGGKVNYLIKKMASDYGKAAKALAAIMNEWHMVHNLVDGLPTEAILQLQNLQSANPKKIFGFVGLEGLQERIFKLPVEQIESLLGVVASVKDNHNFGTAELRELINELSHKAGVIEFDVTSIQPVSPDKLEFNNLPGHWRSLIAGGWQNAHIVEEYIDKHGDPLIGVKIAKIFQEQYLYLEVQHLQPGNIMSHLYEMVAGVAGVTAERQVATQALLAYLFEKCDIFKNKPLGAAA